MLLLLKLRPGFFSPEEQARSEEIAHEITKTAILVVLGFIATSAFRVWQIKAQNKSLSLGVGMIVVSYMPAFAFYSHQRSVQMKFVREMSDKYEEQVSDSQLTAFLDQLKKS